MYLQNLGNLNENKIYIRKLFVQTTFDRWLFQSSLFINDDISQYDG